MKRIARHNSFARLKQLLSGTVIDATYGRRTRAVVITDSGHVVLSAVQPETVAHRFTSKEIIEDEEEATAGAAAESE